jgi:prepilin-type N-terminal cleavage/methylation domain-containing protein
MRNQAQDARLGPPWGRAFTLIELLIVVAIIAILAAIAVPNFLEAQTRAKVSRVKADLRVISIALEVYCVDEKKYPPNSPDGMGVLPPALTTPVAYLLTGQLIDPFATQAVEQGVITTRFYTYDRILSADDWPALLAAGIPQPMEAIDNPLFNLGAMNKYGFWRLVSKGPDGVYADKTRFPRVLYGSDIVYDPSNGSVSFGNLFRLQNGKDDPGH